MNRRFEAWRRAVGLWAVPLGFCLLNLLILAVYQSLYAGRVEGLEDDYQKLQIRLGKLRDHSAEIDAYLGLIETQGQDIARLEKDHFRTEGERFTRALKEVRQRAREAGLQPTTWAYGENPLEEEGLIQRQIAFSVTGTYSQLRQFVNSLELSEQFLTLNDVSLSDSGSDRLNIRLRLSTVFLTGEQPRTAAEGERT